MDQRAGDDKHLVVHPGRWYPHGTAAFPEILYRDESVIAVQKLSVIKEPDASHFRAL